MKNIVWNKLTFLVFLLLVSALNTTIRAQNIVQDGNVRGAGDFLLAGSGNAAMILVDDNDFKVVHIAAQDLAEDVKAVTGLLPEAGNSARTPGIPALLVGTLGKSGEIDALVASGKLDTSEIKGKWESFIISVVDADTMVIAGSDRRGTAFGVYELSRQIGVNPWYWWADVPAKKKDEIIISAGAHVFGPPSVKYRGIFLNDEDFGLKPWAAKTFEPEVGDIGPKTYAKIFELLLRLKANYIWPAMHNCTHAFNHYPENKVVADDYAIVMGASHCELMLRNNVDEWDHDVRGKWDWTVNKDEMIRYWEERVEENGKYENVYTIGLRGVHDSPMEGGGTLDEQTERMGEIFDTQRGMLAKYVDEDVTKVPQVFCPYKEVLEIYRNGLEVPDDVTLLWVDDNFGYIRQLSTPAEQARPGGAGVYYHISYWGPPHDYLWLNTTPPALIWAEMNKAYDYNARDVWVVNVGDLKPGEIGMDFFLQMGWDIDRWTLDTLPDFLETWAAETFGTEHAAAIADILNRYYVLNYQRKPELMGFYLKYSIQRFVQDPEFSLYNYGDEATERNDAFMKLVEDTSSLARMLPSEFSDSFGELVLYPAISSAFLNRKLLSSYKNRIYSRQKRTSSAFYAEDTEYSLKQVQGLTDFYNTQAAGGKWMHMMSDHPNDLPAFTLPPLREYEPEPAPRLAISMEGTRSSIRDPEEKSPRLPIFNRLTRTKYFIDMYNMGTGEIEWTARASDDWIKISETSGTFDLETRLFVDIDYDKAPADRAMGEVILSGAGAVYTVKVMAMNQKDTDPAPGAFTDDNGVISIYAESFAVSKPGASIEWKKIPGLGRTGASMFLQPFTAAPVPQDKITAESPVLENPLYVTSGGNAEVIVHAIPTHEINDNYSLKCAVSIDDGKPVVIQLEQSLKKEEEVWQQNVMRNTMTGTAKLEIPDGSHTLKLWGMDPSVIVDNIIIDLGGLRDSYLGPKETKVVNE